MKEGKNKKRTYYEDMYPQGLQFKHFDLQKESNVQVDENIQKDKQIVKMSEMTEYMMEQLVKKYKDDFQAMSVDLKLNPLQYTAKKLEYYYNKYINLGKEIEVQCNKIIPKQDEQKNQEPKIKKEDLQRMQRIQQLQKQFQ